MDRFSHRPGTRAARASSVATNASSTLVYLPVVTGLQPWVVEAEVGDAHLSVAVMVPRLGKSRRQTIDLRRTSQRVLGMRFDRE
jgi:hypothetical protein